MSPSLHPDRAGFLQVQAGVTQNFQGVFCVEQNTGHLGLLFVFVCYIIANWELLVNRLCFKNLWRNYNTTIALLVQFSNTLQEKSVYFTITSDQCVLHHDSFLLCYVSIIANWAFLVNSFSRAHKQKIADWPGAK